ncbi:uncharacterized protein C5orf46 homolog [Trichosurus vulpecula]|uniref:uncharacterized protein C5orf46 homolog n=1 Tax=Trichosurus vulpecula TaxID=9337 RepID=UPI00186B02CF|nr:uncharacterized protein C5orf46 homolog [Trichosurus vulpecula]
MAASVLHMMMALGLLTLILPCHAGDEPSNSGENSDKDLPSVLNFLGTGIIDSAVDYVLNSIFRKS